MSIALARPSWLRGRGDGPASAPSLRRRITRQMLLELVRVDAAHRCSSLATEDFQAVDWSQLLELAYREDLAPLVYHTLLQSGVETTKEVPFQKFFYVYHLTRRRNAQADEQLAEALSRLKDAGIEAMVLKGAALAQGVYPDPGLRPFSDIDVLVGRRDVGRAHHLLCDLGYRFNYRGGPIVPPSGTDLKFRSARQYFHGDRERLSIDLYWQLGRYPYIAPIDYTGLWERASRLTLGDAPALVPSPEDAVLHLSLEFILGLWYGAPEVKYLRDIAEIVYRQEVDWDALTSRYERTALAAPLYYSCRLSKKLLGADIPKESLDTIHPGAGRRQDWIVKGLKKHIFGSGHPVEYALLVELLRLAGPESNRDKVGWLARLLVPPRELWGSIPRRLAGVFLGRAG